MTRNTSRLPKMPPALPSLSSTTTPLRCCAAACKASQPLPAMLGPTQLCGWWTCQQRRQCRDAGGRVSACERHCLARNIGFTGGNNMALAALGFSAPVPPDLFAHQRSNQPPNSQPDYVLLLNPDAELTVGGCASFSAQCRTFHAPHLWSISAVWRRPLPARRLSVPQPCPSGVGRLSSRRLARRQPVVRQRHERSLPAGPVGAVRPLSGRLCARRGHVRAQRRHSGNGRAGRGLLDVL